MLRVGPVGYTMEVGRMMEDIPKEGGGEGILIWQLGGFMNVSQNCEVSQI
jgi:hypothetical protein